MAENLQERAFRDLKERTGAEIETLFLWSEESARTGWVLGEPVPENTNPEYMGKLAKIMGKYNRTD